MLGLSSVKMRSRFSLKESLKRWVRRTSEHVRLHLVPDPVGTRRLIELNDDRVALCNAKDKAGHLDRRNRDSIGLDNGQGMVVDGCRLKGSSAYREQLLQRNPTYKRPGRRKSLKEVDVSSIISLHTRLVKAEGVYLSSPNAGGRECARVGSCSSTGQDQVMRRRLSWPAGQDQSFRFQDSGAAEYSFASCASREA
jgi:hypothetical protein